MEHHAIPYVREAVIFLVTAAVVAPVFHRIKVSPIVGYLLMGTLIGPFGLGLFTGAFPWLETVIITDVKGVAALAELGVIFLLFVIGLELSFERLWSMRRYVFGLGGSQVLVTGAVIGGVALAWGNSTQVAILLGASLALSSTAIVMQLLIDSGRLGSRTGRTAFSILLFQDLAVVPILFLVGVFTMDTGASPTLGLLSALGEAALAITAIVIVGRTVLRRLFRLAAGTGSPEVFMAAILLVVVGTATASAAFGLSMALGAFLAGLLLAETEYRHQVEVDIEPFKGLLMALFFMSVGMGIDVRILVEQGGLIAMSVAGLLLIKTSLITGLCRVFRLPWSLSVETGVLLSQGGEFAFIVVGAALTAGLVASDVAQFMLITTGITMLLTPGLEIASRRIGSILQAREVRSAWADEEDQEGLEGHAVIAGYGRVGRRIAKLLDREGFPNIAIDNNANRVAEKRSLGLSVIFGDAARPKLMDQAKVSKAAVVVVTMNDAQKTERVVQAVRARWPDLPIYVRARDGAHAKHLMDIGATDVVPETVEAALQLGDIVLKGVGMPEEAADRRIAAEREAAMEEIKEG